MRTGNIMSDRARAYPTGDAQEQHPAPVGNGQGLSHHNGRVRRKMQAQCVRELRLSFDLVALRNIVNSFYTVKKEIPTLKKLLAAAKRDLNFPAWRARYLRRMKENNELGADKKPVTYLDETWINSHYTVRKCWQNSSDASVMKNTNPGQRWILVHAGEYHDEMDTINFVKWLNEKLLPNLPPNGIVVIDNAPYHSTQAEKVPHQTALKSEMQNFLTSQNITFNPKMTKPELYQLIKANKPEKKYIVDELSKEHGHEVVRLPPYHCDLNPIEYIWNLVKQRVADKNIDQSERQIEKLTKEAIKSITVED
ncbi:hypothetical protein B5X24_HaOG200819 [Helicoverpa armigera]|uniref:Tc1-like transposase DDE domain-containing protein n=1 Tax=Helicoverpa armigera TaxID=29058 RepID=A0A2W1BN45_HELAM|nr:hypothetical protein B5X24_HaOG200819 [Helicoverpa armigera]